LITTIRPSPGRRPLTTNTAAGILQLIADHFTGVPALQRSTRDPARSWLMIRQQLAFHPRTADGSVTDEGPHSDVLFALRLTERPPEMTYPKEPSPPTSIGSRPPHLGPWRAW
jgi:hypothetical protein